MKRHLIIVLMLLLLAQIVCAGVTIPLPSELNLFKGESGRFKFQVQAVTSEYALDCAVEMSGETPLVIEFDSETLIVPAGGVKEFYGSVGVPRVADLSTYSTSFCVTCTPANKGAGAAVEVRTCDLPITVNVVEEREKENMTIPPKPLQIPWTLLIIGVLLVGAIIVVIIAIKKSMRHHKQLHHAVKVHTAKPTRSPKAKHPKKKK